MMLTRLHSPNTRLVYMSIFPPVFLSTWYFRVSPITITVITVTPF